MTISYLLAPIPKWVLINNDGTVAGGAKLYTYDSLTNLPKAVFQDPGGTLPWTNPIVFDLNGTQGPFYWEVDSSNLNDTYYLEAYDAQGDLLWTVPNFFPPGAGGGGNTTTYIPINNYLANNQVIDNVGSTANPIGVTNLVIAPSNHQGFTPCAINPVISTYGIVGPDVQFNKNNTAATDQITFPLFALGSAPLTPPDVTPVNYIRYQCTNTPAGETYKNFQWPVCQKVKNLSNQAMTFTIWAAVTSTPVTINIYIRQYYGSGTGATADTRTLIGSCVLSSTWTLFPFNFTVPSVAGNSIGTPGLQTDDDAIYIQIEMPLGAPCDVLFIKPSLYLGTLSPNLSFENYDEINSINSTPRCGDVKVSFYPINPLGWLPMNDGSIGNLGSGATTRANADTFQLYKTLWDGVSNTYAPVSGGRGATAIADFLAGKTLTMPLSLGRALAGSGSGAGLTNRVLGQNVGAETVSLTSANMPSTVPVNASGTGTIPVDSGSTYNVPANMSSGYSAGGNVATSIMQPTSFMMVYIKL